MEGNNTLIGSLQNCVTACENCADACLDEDNVASMTDCIKLDRDCADICNTAVRILVRDSGPDRHTQLIELCKSYCAECAAECENHDHRHCQECAEACRRCEDQCRQYLSQ